MSGVIESIASLKKSRTSSSVLSIDSWNLVLKCWVTTLNSNSIGFNSGLQLCKSAHSTPMLVNVDCDPELTPLTRMVVSSHAATSPLIQKPALMIKLIYL